MSAPAPWLSKSEGKAVVVRDLLDDEQLQASEHWRPFRAGIEILPLYGEQGDEARGGSSAALLRYQPGASVPVHEHPDFEHVVVLRGAQQDPHGNYEQGALVVSEPGSRHSVRSEDGCVVLVIWNAPVAFLGDEEGGTR